MRLTKEDEAYIKSLKHFTASSYWFAFTGVVVFFSPVYYVFNNASNEVLLQYIVAIAALFMMVLGNIYQTRRAVKIIDKLLESEDKDEQA